MAWIRPAFSMKGFQSGKSINFKVYDNLNALIYNGPASEWLNTGVYFVQLSVSFASNRTYLVIATDTEGTWKAARMYSSNDQI